MSFLSSRLRIGIIASLATSIGVGLLGLLGAAGAAGSTKVSTPNLKPFYSQKLVWTACEDKMSCTWLTVPRSYLTNSTHGTFKIRVIKDPATGTRAQYQGALIMNPGGPGGSGYSMIKHSGRFKAKRCEIGIEVRLLESAAKLNDGNDLAIAFSGRILVCRRHLRRSQGIGCVKW